MGRQLIYAILAVAMTSTILAQPLAPGLVNYQGQLRDDQGQPLATADYEMSFALHRKMRLATPNLRKNCKSLSAFWRRATTTL